MSVWHMRDAFDGKIKAAVVDEDEYRLSADMADWAVLDCGGHIGCFARVCAERGAKVLSVEPDEYSGELWKRNMMAMADALRASDPSAACRAAIIRAAIGPEDGAAILRAWCADPACRTTRATSRPALDITAVPQITLERAAELCRAFAQSEAIDLLKIDIEGSEYDCVPGYDFAGVRRVAVEFHDFEQSEATRGKADECRQHLAAVGFVEQAWEEVHAADGGAYWYRLYLGSRSDSDKSQACGM